MRRALLSVVVATALALPAIFAACSTDSPAATTSAAGDGGGFLVDASAFETGTGIDAASLPQAMGDACRGVPLPVDQHFVPAGMCAHVVASALGAIRQLTFAPNGDLFGVTASGSIRRFRDVDGDGFFQLGEITTYAETGGNGNNCHIDVANGYLYAGSPNGVKRWPYSPTATDGGAGEDVVTGQPATGHAKHTVHVYDGFLYVHSGSSTNVSDPKSPEYDDQRSLIRRFALAAFTPGTPFAWPSGEVVTKGLRNANGFTKNAAGRMYAVVNGLDDVGYAGQNVHDDNPGEQVVEIAMGKAYGYPYCFTAQRVIAGGQVIAPGTQLQFGTVHDDAWCAANSSPPATFIQAHSAPLDLTFFDDQPRGALPERFRGGAFVALHGSWDRSPATGYKVIWIPFDASGNAPMPSSSMTDTAFPYEVVLGGGNASAPVDGPWSWASGDYSDQPRFAGVAISPVDGALYATSDSGGYIYRLGEPKAP
jgi:glucose/arabinose dehydrogenase